MMKTRAVTMLLKLSLVQGKNYGDGWDSGSRSKNIMSSMCHRADCGYDSQV